MQSEQINELAAALAKAQGSMRVAVFDRVNPHFRNKYASLASTLDAIRKPLSDNGLSITQITTMRDGAFLLVTTLRHASGQWVVSEYPLPINAKPQELGSALTYARRYSVASLINIASDDDDDAEGASIISDTQAISSEQVDNLNAMINEVGADVDGFAKYFKISRLTDLPVREYQRAVAALEAKRAKK